MSKIKNLATMMGKTWQDTNTEEIFKFLSYTQTKDVVTVATDQEWQTTTVYDLNLFMKRFVEVQVTNTEVVIIKPEAASTPAQLLSNAIDSGTMRNLKDILIENITKVNADPAFIKQANQISNTVNTLINLAKVEIQLKSKQ